MKILILKQLVGSHLYDSIKPCYDIDLLLRGFLNSLYNEFTINGYKEWLVHDDQDWTGIYSFITYKDSGNVYIYFEFDTEEERDEYELPVKTFSKMLDDWSEILKKQ